MSYRQPSAHGRWSPLPALVLLAAMLCLATSTAAAGPFPGYLGYAELTAELELLAESPLAELSSLGRTAGDREVWLLTVGSGDTAAKPAIAIVGSVDARQLFAADLALRMAQRLTGRQQDAAALLEDVTFYIIPCPSPDASEAFFQAPHVERQGNTRATDDDRDFELDEDGFEDLNGDGLITMMRIARPGGEYRTHPEDARAMIKADAARNEAGQYLLLSEGIDNDEDGQYNEDGAGGVVFNRNFTYSYPYFAAGAGPHQVSEPETRAVADFFFDHPNIAITFSFSPEDNLMHPWKPRPGGQQRGIVTSVHGEDAPLYAYVAERYQQLREEAGLKRDCPPTAGGAGSFTEWAYYHYGRLSLAARGWWPIRPEDKPADEPAPEDEEAAAEEPVEPETKPANEEAEKPEDVGDRGKYELIALEWLADAGIDGFVDWTPIEHPDFPGQLVEVGGFKPYVLLNPPAAELDELAELHFDFLMQLAGLLPRLEFAESKAEDLGAGLYRLSVTIVNLGYLPTVTAMGETSRVPYPLQYELELPQGAELVSDYPRGRLERLAGNGGRVERAWLIRAPDGGSVGLTVGCPSVGRISTELELAAGAGGAQ